MRDRGTLRMRRGRALKHRPVGFRFLAAGSSVFCSATGTRSLRSADLSAAQNIALRFPEPKTDIAVADAAADLPTGAANAGARRAAAGAAEPGSDGFARQTAQRRCRGVHNWHGGRSHAVTVDRNCAGPQRHAGSSAAKAGRRKPRPSPLWSRRPKPSRNRRLPRRGAPRQPPGLHAQRRADRQHQGAAASVTRPGTDVACGRSGAAQHRLRESARRHAGTVRPRTPTSPRSIPTAPRCRA